MASIRKTKNRLKLDTTDKCRAIWQGDISYVEKMLEQELENIKRKEAMTDKNFKKGDIIRKVKRWCTTTKYAMELVESPSKEEQELAWHIKAAVDKSREKIKLEDMTLAQIKEQKGILADKVRNAIAKAVVEYLKSYDCGDVGISVATEVTPPLETEQGEIVVPSQYCYDIRIKFSKEDE